MTLLNMSAVGGVLILAVVVLRALFMSRLPKKTFLALWALVLLRLLVPGDLPSPFSAYNAVPKAAVEAVARNPVVDYVTTYRTLPIAPKPGENGVTREDYGPPVHLGAILWISGTAVCALFFLAAYCRLRWRYREALPAEGDYIKSWLERQNIRRPLSVRVYDRVAAPLTYGVLRPVILLPRSGGWGSDEKLGYVLAHELVHVRRFDPLWKLVLTAALCIHWFNPLVWVMYLLANRDIERSCDEAVIRALGEECKSAYAKTLIGMEARQSGLMPFCNGFSKSAIELRVKAIMKFKKTTALAALAAVVMVATVCICFATSAQPARSYAQERYPELMAMKFDGYEALTIDEYRAKVVDVIAPWDGTDRAFSLQIDRMTGDQAIREAQYTDDDAWFLMNTLRLSMMDGWKSQQLSGGAVIDGVEGNIGFRYTVEDASKLTVGERDRVLRGYLVDGVEELVREFKAGGKLEIEDYLFRTYHSDGLSISDFSYNAYQMEGIFEPVDSTPPDADLSADEPWEPREFPDTTNADYEKILALMTDGYKDETVADFNENLLRHMNDVPGFYKSYWGVWEDIGRGEGSYELTDAQRTFIDWTLDASNTENAAMVKTEAGYSTTPDCSLPEYWRTVDRIQLRAELRVGYQIPDGSKLTVAQRDAAISGVLGDMKDYLDQLSKDGITALDDAVLAAEFNRLIQKYSTSAIILEPMKEEDVFFEIYDLGVPDGPEVMLDKIRLQYYDDGSPYLHYTWKNVSEKTVTRLQYCLLAYDGSGNPLRLHWNMLDSSAGTSYGNIVESELTIQPGEIYDIPGGWSLERPTQVSTALACIIWADFEDGTTWINPEYDWWRSTYLGQPIDIGSI